MKRYTSEQIQQLNQSIAAFPEVHAIREDMTQTFDGISRMVMLDRYTVKDVALQTLQVGDLVVATLIEDSQYPTRGIGYVLAIDGDQITLQVEEEYQGAIGQSTIQLRRTAIEKPLEIYFEQIAARVAGGIAEKAGEKRAALETVFYQEMAEQNFIPAGRVLYGAGTDSQVTYFNCYVMPLIPDSRGGISDHRKQVMEIMSRGGGVGTNGSTLRPKHAYVRGVNGKSSGAVSWLNDLSQLTHLVEQGGSRRGAQMIMMADWHPDIIEFVIAKMQNPDVLRKLIQETQDEDIRRLAEEKLQFMPLEHPEIYQAALTNEQLPATERSYLERLLKVGGSYGVKDPDCLTGANISVCVTQDFMEAVAQDADYELRFPAVEKLTAAEMAIYDREWQELGDVRQWAAKGYPVTVYKRIKARELWHLITLCATYSAEPGIFFIDNANEMTNAQAYGQQVVATNPCGEQPLPPYSVCNLAAINLANMVNKETGTIDYEKLRQSVTRAVQFQDLVIDATPYFLEENRKQALGERRIGLGVMGLADLLIYTGTRYGSPKGIKIVEEVFQTMAETAYATSIELAQEKGSFPFLVGETEEETLALRRRFISSGYMKRMPEKIRQDILRYGIRNSHLLTVAPTGSTGTMVGVATGLEPYFSFRYFRSGRLGKSIEVQADIVADYFRRHPEADTLPEEFVSAMELLPEEHVAVQCAIQRWVDSSISKTVNAPKGYTVAEVASVYEALYTGGAKGGTVYVDGSRDSQVLSLEAEVVEQTATATVEQETIVYGSEPGNRCPICREGEVVEIGGCSTCTNCKVQLKCGL